MLKKSSVKFSSENTFSKTPVSSKRDSPFSPEDFDFENRNHAGRTPSAKMLQSSMNAQRLKENLNMDMFAPKLTFQGSSSKQDSLFRLHNKSPEILPLGDISNLNFSPRPNDSIKSPTRGRVSKNLLSQPSPISTSQSFGNESEVTGQVDIFSPTYSVIRGAEIIVSPDSDGFQNKLPRKRVGMKPHLTPSLSSKPSAKRGTPGGVLFHPAPTPTTTTPTASSTVSSNYSAVGIAVDTSHISSVLNSQSDLVFGNEVSVVSEDVEQDGHRRRAYPMTPTAALLGFSMNTEESSSSEESTQANSIPDIHNNASSHTDTLSADYLLYDESNEGFPTSAAFNRRQSYESQPSPNPDSVVIRESTKSLVRAKPTSHGMEAVQFSRPRGESRPKNRVPAGTFTDHSELNTTSASLRQAIQPNTDKAPTNFENSAPVIPRATSPPNSEIDHHLFVQQQQRETSLSIPVDTHAQTTQAHTPVQGKETFTREVGGDTASVQSATVSVVSLRDNGVSLGRGPSLGRASRQTRVRPTAEEAAAQAPVVKKVTVQSSLQAPILQSSSVTRKVSIQAADLNESMLSAAAQHGGAFSASKKAIPSKSPISSRKIALKDIPYKSQSPTRSMQSPVRAISFKNKSPSPVRPVIKKKVVVTRLSPKGSTSLVTKKQGQNHSLMDQSITHDQSFSQVHSHGQRRRNSNSSTFLSTNEVQGHIDTRQRSSSSDQKDTQTDTGDEGATDSVVSEMTAPSATSRASNTPFPNNSCMHYSSISLAVPAYEGRVRKTIALEEAVLPHVEEEREILAEISTLAEDNAEEVEEVEVDAEVGSLPSNLGSVDDDIQRVQSSVYRSENARHSNSTSATAHSQYIKYQYSPPSSSAHAALNTTNTTTIALASNSEEMEESLAHADSVLSFAPDSTTKPLADSMIAVANQTVSSPADSSFNSPPPNGYTPNGPWPNTNSISSPIFMSYRKQQHDSDSEDEVAEFGLDELLKDMDRHAVQEQEQSSSQRKLFHSKVYEDHTVRHRELHRSGAVRVRSTSADPSSARKSRFDIHSVKASNTTTAQMTVRSLSASRSRSNSAMKGGAVRVTPQQQRLDEIKSSVTYGRLTSSPSPYHEQRSSSTMNRTDMAAPTSDFIDDLETLDSRQQHAGNESSYCDQSDLVGTAVPNSSSSHYYAESVDGANLNDITAANTTMTIDHSYQMSDNGLFSLDPDTSIYRKHRTSGHSKGTTAQQTYPMAIKSVKRDRDHLPEVKEITFGTVPGQYTVIKLRFNNMHSKPMVLKTQAIQIRFECVHQFHLVENQLDIGNYNSFEVVSERSMTVPKGKDGCVQVRFSPMQGVEGNYSGALKVKYARKSFILLLRGEARYPADYMQFNATGPSGSARIQSAARQSTSSPSNNMSTLAEDMMARERQEQQMQSPQPQVEDSLIVFNRSIRSKISRMMGLTGDSATGKKLLSSPVRSSPAPMPVPSTVTSPLVQLDSIPIATNVPIDAPSSASATKTMTVTDEDPLEKVEEAVSKEFLSPVVRRTHSKARPVEADCQEDNASYGPNTEYLLRKIRSSLVSPTTDSSDQDREGDRDSISRASARTHVDEMILSVGGSLQPVTREDETQTSGRTASPPAPPTPATAVRTVPSTAAITMVPTPTGVGSSFVSEMDHSSYTHTLAVGRNNNMHTEPITPARMSGAAALMMLGQRTPAGAVPPSTATMRSNRPQFAGAGSISGSVVSANYSNLTASNVQLLDNKRGVFFKKQHVHFGSHPIGSLKRAKIELCNSTDHDVVVFLGDPALPFVLCHNEIRLRARSYVRVPVRFVPIARAETESELVVQSADGEHHSSIKLCGIAY
jgi:hypothetical protein